MRHRRVLSVAVTFSLVFAATAAFTHLFSEPGSIAGLSGMALSGSQAIAEQARVREQRRQYSQVQSLCRDRAAKGEAVVCPTIDDTEGIAAFLTGSTHAAASAPVAGTNEAILKQDQLTDYQRDLLRRYQRAGSCPETIEQILPGFHDLCVSLVGERGRRGRIQGIISDKAAMRRANRKAPPLTLLDRINAFARPRPDR